MSMDRVIQVDEHDFISPVVNFKAFKKDAIKRRDELRSALNLPPLNKMDYPDYIPPPAKHVRVEEIVPNESPSTSADSVLADLFGISETHARSMLENISVEHLAATNKRDVFFRRNVTFDDIPEETQLDTLKYKRSALEKYQRMKRTPVTKTAEAKLKEEDRKIRSQMASQLHTETVMQKYCDVFENELKHEHLKGTQKSITDDIIVTVVILRPFNAPIEAGDTRLRSLHPYWKFLLRGETSLTDFHSLFRCSADFGISIPNKDETPELYDFNFIKYPSSFIFIHDTFYVPHEYRMSAEASQQIDPERLNPLIDISEPIRDWMKKKKHDFGPTKMQRLGDFKIIDLECRLGCPYVYIHQGCCEHVFYFTDLRLMDVQDFPGSYPHKISDTSIEHYCIGCCRRVATWIVENETFPVCPARMCDECYRDYHFVHTHRRKLPVKAYPYSDPSSLQF